MRRRCGPGCAPRALPLVPQVSRSAVGPRRAVSEHDAETDLPRIPGPRRSADVIMSLIRFRCNEACLRDAAASLIGLAHTLPALPTFLAPSRCVGYCSSPTEGDP
ncbi:hypothetical protein WOLCODRAFT_156128 [Wolfiporia cocos MD-104 SS10]|uniref:Uncharacterized protein n=1 Tax=Wolfiporia cocos (strain MD-104) TaxID=742152 RepID=A0A2H3J0F1_WOLCO|nr:hypothetical protein WOLCODRAFT_156128 [Wolfiporia cocos MD-104 SS10]